MPWRERPPVGHRAELALILGLWMGASAFLDLLTTRVRDWFVMTDEMLYSKFAIHIAQTGSPVPRLHEVYTPSLAQLYPLLVSPFFRHGSMPHDLWWARFAGPWIMASACIPAYLLARRVSGSQVVALGLGALTI